MRQIKTVVAPSKISIPIVSLFCGCGAFDLGFAAAGFDIRLALDINGAAIRSYNHNREHKVAHQADLMRTTASDILTLLGDKRRKENRPRGVIGGAPCQSFSCANVHSRADDSRHSLPREFARIVREMNEHFSLDFFVFENVRGLTYKKHNETFAEFKRLFKGAGFVLHEGMLDAADFGVPQRRPRVFVVGLNKQKFEKTQFKFPEASCERHRKVVDVLGDLPEPMLFMRSLTRPSIPYHPNHWTMRPVSSKFESGSLQQGYAGGRSFRVLSWDKPSWTVAYGNREVHVHPSGHRRLSVYEAMLLQGLPSSYELIGNLSEQFRQVSDAVPPQLGTAVGASIAEVLYA